MSLRRDRRATRSGGAPAAPRRRSPRARVRLDNDARRAQLLELGMKIFEEKTYDEVSIDDLARAAGISKGLLYHYFPTKRDLYLTGLRAVAAELLERTNFSEGDAPPIERMRQGIDAYLTFVSERSRSYIALMRGGIGSDPEVLAIVDESRGEIIERIITGPGSPLAATADPRTPLARTALRGWLGFAEATAIDWLSHRDLDQRTVRDLLVDMLVPTLRLAMGFPLSRDW